ncbi:MAG TPA: S9 family peptidase [Planctomycetes bacterium]|nr:S9 family peptidase [Planctomycetota bacterium]
MRIPVSTALLGLLLCGPSFSQAGGGGLRLEELFPKGGLFGPGARGMAFSPSGRFAAFLYRPYAEKRHGNDLYLVELPSGRVRRLTSAELLGNFQEKTRKLLALRKKQRAALKKKGLKGAALLRAFWKADRKAKKAPRYPGVARLFWNPKKDILYFLSRGDLYSFGDLSVPKPKIRRWTRRREGVRDLRFFPNGKGFLLRTGDRVELWWEGALRGAELPLGLKEGDRLRELKISPDNKLLAFRYTHATAPKGPERKVKIASYKERFAKVREVPRRVADDPIPKEEDRVALFPLGGLLTESHKPRILFAAPRTGPRDRTSPLEWSLDARRLAFARFTQVDSKVGIYQYETRSGTQKTKKPKEANKARLLLSFLHTGGPNTPGLIRPSYLADGRRLAFVTEISGYRQVHVFDPRDEYLRQVTDGRFELFPEGMDPQHRSLYLRGNREGVERVDLYRLDFAKARLKRLSPERGSYERPAFGPEGRFVLANFSAWGRPRELVLIDLVRGRQKTLTHSHPRKTLELTRARPRLFRYKNRHGQWIHGLGFAPRGWDPPKTKAKKLPLLIYVYGGPLSSFQKNVREGNFNGFGYFFARYMAERHGFLAVTIDPRGMSGYGAMFEKANYGRVGRPQVEDLVDGVRYLVKTQNVDPHKVAIHGWSFGGFQTQLCLYTAPEVFQVGIAGAGPTEWENYNSWYTTGTIGKSRVGVPDLHRFSLLPLAKNLRGRLLLVHGMEDSNVLYQDTVRVYRELLKAGKETQVELFLDPTGGHGLHGDVSSLARARKYEAFLLRSLPLPPKRRM